jgi:DnaB-like helicase N terminal domain
VTDLPPTVGSQLLSRPLACSETPSTAPPLKTKMLALSGEGIPIDLFTVREELRRRNKEEAAGGVAYLASLTDGLPG